MRELQNALEWAVAIARSPLIAPEDLPEAIRLGKPSPVDNTGEATLQEHEKELIIRSINRCHGNLKEVAKLLGIGRTTLWRKMREYGIRK